jgi:hypothetical protein
MMHSDDGLNTQDFKDGIVFMGLRSPDLVRLGRITELRSERL